MTIYYRDTGQSCLKIVEKEVKEKSVKENNQNNYAAPHYVGLLWNCNASLCSWITAGFGWFWGTFDTWQTHSLICIRTDCHFLFCIELTSWIKVVFLFDLSTVPQINIINQLELSYDLKASYVFIFKIGWEVLSHTQNTWVVISGSMLGRYPWHCSICHIEDLTRVSCK